VVLEIDIWQAAIRTHGASMLPPAYPYAAALSGWRSDFDFLSVRGDEPDRLARPWTSYLLIAEIRKIGPSFLECVIGS
jgi:hypothetical protein